MVLCGERPSAWAPGHHADHGLCDAQHTDEDNWAAGEERTEQGHPAQPVKHPPSTQEAQGRSLGQEDPPGEGNGKPTSTFLPGESHGQRSLAGCSSWGHRVRHD